MLQKKKLTRKRNREWRKFTQKLLIFFVVFASTLGILLLAFNKGNGDLLSPLSFANIISKKPVTVSSDTSEVKKILEAKKIAFDDIKVSSEGAYMVRLRTGEDVILSPKKDLSKQLSSLQVIYSRLTMEGRSLRKLDLRYDKPVVVFK